jgi:hypothetical protein
MKNTYKITNLPEFQSRIAFINRKAVKIGAPEVHLTLIDSYTETQYVEYFEEGRLMGSEEHPVKVFEVELESEPVIIEGWHLTHSLIYDPVSGENIIMSHAGVNLEPEYRNRVTCDHCKTDRPRVRTYILRKDSEIKQVGSSCLRDFLGGHDAEFIIQMFEFQNWLMKAIDELSEFEFNPSGRGSARGFERDKVLGISIMLIDKSGYIRADDTTALSTKLRVFEILTDKNITDIPELREPGIQAKIVEVRNWVESNLDDSDYITNLKVILRGEYVNERYLGFAVSSYQSYRASIKRAEMEAARADSKHIGNVGDKIQIKVKILRKTGIETIYGISTLIIMVDESGNIIKWFSSRGIMADEGEEVTIKGTIKTHDEYQGTKQTQLTRCKIVEEKES